MTPENLKSIQELFAANPVLTRIDVQTMLCWTKSRAVRNMREMIDLGYASYEDKLVGNNMVRYFTLIPEESRPDGIEVINSSITSRVIRFDAHWNKNAGAIKPSFHGRIQSSLHGNTYAQ